MKQPNTWTCGAACAAMIAGVSLEDFFCAVGHDGSEAPWQDSPHPEKRRAFSFKEIAMFLLNRDITVGMGFSLSAVPKMSEPFTLKISIDPQKWPMLIGVESERFAGLQHWIYWDTRQIWDPNPDTEDGRRLSSYTVVDAYILHMPERCQ